MPPSPLAVRPMFTFPPPAPQRRRRTTGLAGPSRAFVLSPPSPPRAQPALSSQPPAQSEQHQLPVPFRFGLLRSDPSSPTNSEGSTDTASPPPALAPALSSSRRPLQREQAHTRLDNNFAPRLRPASFSPQSARWPLQQVTTVLPPSPEPLARALAQVHAGPSRPLPRRALQLPVRSPAQAQAGASRLTPRAQAGPSTPLMRAPMERPVMCLPHQHGPPRTGEPRHRAMLPIRIRDPSDPHFFMPLPPADIHTKKPGDNVIGRSRQAPARITRSPSDERIIEIADSLGLPLATPDEYALMSFAQSPGHTPAVTADEDEDGQLPLALDVSSSDSSEGNVKDVGDGIDGENGYEQTEDPEDEAGDEPEGTDGQLDEANTGGTARLSAADKGKGRAVNVEDNVDINDAAGGDFWSTTGGFVPDDDEESVSSEDIGEQQLALAEENAHRTTCDGPAATLPALPAQAGPRPDSDFQQAKGASRAEMQRIARTAQTQAEQIEATKWMRKDMERSLRFLENQRQQIYTLTMVMHAKRLALEETMVTLEAELKERSKNDHTGRDGDEGNNGGDNTGAVGRDGEPIGDAPIGEVVRVDEHDASDKHRENYKGRGAGGNDASENGEPSKASEKLAPPVAAGQRAAQRMVRRLKRLPSISRAGPSTSQTARNAPALLPAWKAVAPRRAKPSWESSSDSDSSPSPVLSSAHVRLRSPLAKPVTPPPRTSAPLRRNLESARSPLSELLVPVSRPLALSTARGAAEALPLAVLARGDTARRGSLTGAFALSGANEHPLFGGGRSYTSFPRAGEPHMPRATRRSAEGGAGSSASFGNLYAETNEDRDGSASQLRAYRPPPIPDYDGRSVPISEDDNDKQPGDDGEPNEEDEPYYEYAAPYEDAYAGFRDLRGANIRAWS
ncbi:hypothetical protein C8Q72DRAFT_817521 [Fomitopsis betulina]|nr:hypothetical protein C8Q72DRAFT_817521 [Fomitopsis betulina]